MKLTISHAKRLKNFFANSPLNKTFIIDSLLRKNIADAIAEHAWGKTIDLGCGEMPYREKLQAQGEKYFSLDYPGATNYFDEKLNRIDVFGDAQKTPFTHESFNTVFSSEVLEHVPDPRAMIEECYRILTPEGALLLTVPYCYKIHLEPHDYFRFTKHGLHHLVTTAGFTDVDIRPIGGNLAAIGQSLSNYLHEAFIADPVTHQPRSLFHLALVLPFCALLQSLFLLLDKVSTLDSLTLGYLVCAKKE